MKLTKNEKKRLREGAASKDDVIITVSSGEKISGRLVVMEEIRRFFPEVTIEELDRLTNGELVGKLRETLL